MDCAVLVKLIDALLICNARMNTGLMGVKNFDIRSGQQLNCCPLTEILLNPIGRSCLDGIAAGDLFDKTMRAMEEGAVRHKHERTETSHHIEVIFSA